MPLDINRSYRFAFLVAAIETKPPFQSGGIASSIFNFFTKKTEDGTPKHEVLVIAFRVPDIATNKGGGDDSGSVYWEDPTYLTRNILLPQKQVIEINDVKRPERRAKYYNKPKQMLFKTKAAVFTVMMDRILAEREWLPAKTS